MRSARNFAGNNSGNIAITSAFSLMMLMTAGAVSIDYSVMYNQSSRLQEAADHAALSAVKEAALEGWKGRSAGQVASLMISTKLANTRYATLPYKEAVTVNANANSVTVEIKQKTAGYFLDSLPNRSPYVTASATARATGRTSVCIIALHPSDSNALSIVGKSSLTANGCAAYSNSLSSAGMAVLKGAVMDTTLNCTAGGYKGSAGAYRPEPVTDCPVVDDPLADRAQPPVGPCVAKNLVLKGGTHTLQPGTYCGGISTKGNVNVKLQPGVYVIKDGMLNISGNSTFAGENVGFFFTGEEATFTFNTATTLSLTAPRSGDLAGILFFEDRDEDDDERDFIIKSKDAQRMVGTIYLKRGRLAVSKESKYGQRSEWSAIIANRIDIANGPDLQINSNYAASKVPAPAGITGKNARSYLSN